MTQHFAQGIDIAHHTIDLKIGDHFLDTFGYDKGAGFAGRFKDIAARLGHPVMFKILRAAYQNKAVHGGRVAMARQ